MTLQPLAPRVLVADDHALMRDGLVLMIQSTWPLARCDVASDYSSVIENLDAFPNDEPYDAIILDLRMPGMRGAESVAKITERASGAAIIVCTALEDPGLVDRLMSTGIRSVVNKTAGAEALIQHLNAALNQLPTPRQKRKNPDVGAGSSGQHGGSAMLTNRQREILKLLHSGKPSKVIATELNVTLDTIKSHLGALYSVMGVTSRAEAVVKSQDWFL